MLKYILLDSASVEAEVRNGVKVQVQDSKYGMNDFDPSTDEGKREKEEPMDDNDTETEPETKDDDNFEEESEDEDIELPDNQVQPGPFKNVDSIVCLATEPDKAMVISYFLTFNLPALNSLSF